MYVKANQDKINASKRQMTRHKEKLKDNQKIKPQNIFFNFCVMF